MPTVVISPIGTPGQQFFDNSGVPLSGGKLYTYEAGTTTLLTTYTTSAGSVARTNPIVMDSAGRVSNDGTWLVSGTAYKFVLKTSVDVTLGTWDNITGALPSSGSTGVPDASTSTKGVTKLSTSPVSPTNPIAVGDNDTRLVGLPYTAPADASTTVKGLTKLGAAPASASDPIAAGNNQWSTTSAAGITRLSTAPAVAATPIAVGDNDTRVPTQGENDALVGTSGTPSSTNKYVTNDDDRLNSIAGYVGSWYDLSSDVGLIAFDVYAGISGGIIRSGATIGTLVPDGALITPTGVPASVLLGEEDNPTSAGSYPNWSTVNGSAAADGSKEWKLAFSRPAAVTHTLDQVFCSLKFGIVITDQTSGLEGAILDGFKITAYTYQSDGTLVGSTNATVNYTSSETADSGTPRYFVAYGTATGLAKTVTAGHYLVIGITPRMHVVLNGAAMTTQKARVFLNPALNRGMNLNSSFATAADPDQNSIHRSRLVAYVGL